jgi:hypothetical protein
MAQIQIVNSAPKGTLAFAKDVTLDNVPDNSKVYCFVFGPTDAQEQTKKDLEILGTESGNNLFVGFWSMADSRYVDLAKYFQLKSLPAIIITAESSLASIDDANMSAYVRLDNRKLLSETESVKQLVKDLFNLFIRGEVVEAIKTAKSQSKKASIRYFFNKIKNIFSDAVMSIINKYNIEFEYGLFKAKLVHPEKAQ